jgi:hypothetical protein
MLVLRDAMIAPQLFGRLANKKPIETQPGTVVAGHVYLAEAIEALPPRAFLSMRS